MIKTLLRGVILILLTVIVMIAAWFAGVFTGLEMDREDHDYWRVLVKKWSTIFE